MRGTGVRAQHHEQVREVGYGEAEMSGGVIVGPGLPEVLGPAPGNVEPRRHLRDLEAGGDDDDVVSTQLAVRGDDALGRETLYGIGDQLDIRLRERPEPVIVE